MAGAFGEEADDDEVQGKTGKDAKKSKARLEKEA